MVIGATLSLVITIASSFGIELVGPVADINTQAGVAVGVSVAVGVRVNVGGAVFVRVGIGVRVLVLVGTGVRVRVAEGRGVRVGVGVEVHRGVQEGSTKLVFVGKRVGDGLVV